MEFPRAAPSGIPQTSLGFRGHLITNFPHIMVLLIIMQRQDKLSQSETPSTESILKFRMDITTLMLIKFIYLHV